MGFDGGVWFCNKEFLDGFKKLTHFILNHLDFLKNLGSKCEKFLDSRKITLENSISRLSIKLLIWIFSGCWLYLCRLRLTSLMNLSIDTKSCLAWFDSAHLIQHRRLFLHLESRQMKTILEDWWFGLGHFKSILFIG